MIENVPAWENKKFPPAPQKKLKKNESIKVNCMAAAATVMMYL